MPPKGWFSRWLVACTGIVGGLLRAQVVLIDVADPPPGQRRDPLGDDRDVPDVQRVRGERRGDAHVQVHQTRAAAGSATSGRPPRGRGERVEERQCPAGGAGPTGPTARSER